MSRFKIFNNIDIENGKTERNNLPDESHKGYCYFDANTNLFYIDIKDSNGKLLNIYDTEYRVALNGYMAACDSEGQNISENINYIKNNYSTIEYMNELVDGYLQQQSAGDLNIYVQKVVLQANLWNNNYYNLYLNKINNGSTLIVPTTDSFADFINNKVCCVNHINNKLEFYCEAIPSNDIYVSIIILDNLKYKPISITDCTYSNIQSLVYYTGYERTQNPIIKYNNNLLQKDVDYIITYKNNIKVGNAQCIITGIDKYYGTITINFKIGISMSQTKVNPIPDRGYTGEQICPKLDIYIDRQKLLEDIDYTLTYYNNTNIGQGSIVVTGINAGQGTITKTFNIVIPNIKLDYFVIPADAIDLTHAITQPVDEVVLDNFTIPNDANNLTFIKR